MSQRRVSPQMVADLSSPVVRARLQAHIDSGGDLPPSGAPDEYAALFERVYPAEADRRAYLDAKTAGARPSYGHLALATFMRAHRTRIVWTTNFDSLIADACAKVYNSTAALTTATLDGPELAEQAINEERWPVEIKLHGDFRSRRLKNTGDELRRQDARLRKLLVQSCQRFGLVVVGYSGRDESVMEALEGVLGESGALPAGLFWLHRGEDPPLPRVVELLVRLAESNVDAALVRVENFDETLRDLVRLTDGIDTEALDAFAAARQRWTAAPRPGGSRGWPVVRLNALPLTQTPSLCRRVVCAIGGYSEVRAAVQRARANLLTARTSAGVLCYGADDEVRAAFEPHGITDFDLHTIEHRRLRYESGERGLLRDALTSALVRQRGLDQVVRQRSSDLLAPADVSEEAFAPLRSLVGPLSGTVKAHAELRWREGIGVRLGWADDRLWLLIEPRVVLEGRTEGNRAAAADFARERTVRRYNRQLNDLIGFWANLLAGDGSDLRALGIGDGVDATFCLSPDTGFSWRARA